MEDALKVASASVGGLTKLADAIGQSAQAVCNWRVRGVPAAQCALIERATAAAVTVEQLRADIRWYRVPDPHWPHVDGRPCIDVAAPVAPMGAA